MIGGGPLHRRDLFRLAGAGAAAGALSSCVRDDPNTLRLMYWGSSFEQDAIKQMTAAFHDRHSGIPVQAMFVPREYETKVNTLVASNKLPDVLYLGASQAYQLAEQGWLVDITKYFKRYPQLADRLPETYFWWEKGRTCGTQTANEVTVLWYNRDLIGKAGIDPPPAGADQAWSWDDMVQAADRLTLDENGRRPSETGFDPARVRQFGISAGLTANWYPLVRSNGGDIVDETGHRYTLNSPESVEVFQKLQDLMYVHRVSPSPAQLGNNAPTSTVQLQTRRTAMVIDGQWVLLDMQQSDLKYGIGVLPSFGDPLTMAQGGASVISAKSKHPEAALELYLFHNDPKNVDLFKDGLWMPLEERYYRDPKLVDSWIGNKAHPPEFRTAVVDYAREHSVSNFAQRLKNMLNIQDVLTPALQRIEVGGEPAKKVLDHLGSQVEPILQGWYPSA